MEPTDYNLSEIVDDILLPKYQNSPNIKATLYSFAEALQSIKDDIFAIPPAFDAPNAVGEQLNYICKPYGIIRGSGETDEALRSRYYAKIARVKSDGTPDVIKTVLESITQANVRVVNNYPNAIHVLFDKAASELGVITAEVLGEVAPAGVEVVAIAEDSNYVTWMLSEEGEDLDASILPEVGETTNMRMAEEISRRV